MRNLWLLLCSFTILLQSSCLDGREEYWIQRDGSGRLEALYMLPSVAISSMGGESAMRAKIEAYFSNQESVKMTHLAIKRESSSVFLEINVSFTRAADFVALLNGGTTDDAQKKPDALDMLLGTMNAERTRLNVTLKRDVDIRELFADSPFPLNEKQTKDRDLEYIIHLPVTVKTSNAHEVTDHGKTLRWSFPLAQALKESLHIELLSPIPIPYWLYAIVVAIALCIAIWMWKILKKSRKNAISNCVATKPIA